MYEEKESDDSLKRNPEIIRGIPIIAPIIVMEYNAPMII
jgi:hypothetical protein